MLYFMEYFELQYHKTIHILPKEHSDTQALVQTLSALLMFGKFKIVISQIDVYS